jgi:hypothetical protein
MSYPTSSSPGFFVPQALLLDERLTPKVLKKYTLTVPTLNNKRHPAKCRRAGQQRGYVSNNWRTVSAAIW